MSKYGEFPGVSVTTESVARSLTYTEKMETMVCIRFCLGDGYIETNGVQSALECLGYSPYRTMPMFQKALKELEEETETFK